MKIDCPNCLTACSVHEHRTLYLRMAAMKCPNCGHPIDLRSLPPFGRGERSSSSRIRCAIFSAGKTLRLFDIARSTRTKPGPPS